MTLNRLGGQLGHLEARRADIERINKFTAAVTRVTGTVYTNGVGEAIVDVKFPCWFIEKPSVSFGGELEQPVMQEGKFPTVSVVVYQWLTNYDDRLGGGYWIGARLAVVTTGRVETVGDTQRMIVHWQAEGKALRSPFTGESPT